MKSIKCEMCNSNDVIKQDGFYVCQYCGTKYSVEEAKKMIIEGTVDVSGSSVKIDQSEELKNLYELARRAKNDNNSENAQKYYDQILVKDPSSWEANFYTVYYQSMNCKIGEIPTAATRLCSCEDTVLNLVKESVTDPEEIKNVLEELAVGLMMIARVLYDSAHDFHLKYKALDTYVLSGVATTDMLYQFGEKIIAMFGDEYEKTISVPCWMLAVNQHHDFYFLLKGSEAAKQKIRSYVAKIQKNNPSFKDPIVDLDGGCYVATCVYGSYDCPQVWTLRRYRDYTLAETWYGRAFIRLYYAVSPTLVKWFGHTEWFKKMWKGKLDRIVKRLLNEGVENTPYQDKEW